MSIDLHGPGLWYATRATGLVTLLLLTVSVLLGLLTAGRFASDGWPRFLTQGLHRNLSLLVLVFLALHVGTTVIDTYTSIPLTAAFVPFASVLQGGLAEPRRGRARPAPRPGRHQPAPGTARVPGLAPGALAGLRLLAGRGGARPGHRHRPERDLGIVLTSAASSASLAVGRLAARRRGPAGGPVTTLGSAPSRRRRPLARLPRLLAGIGGRPAGLRGARAAARAAARLRRGRAPDRRRGGLGPDRPGRRGLPRRAQDALGRGRARAQGGGRQRRGGRACQPQGPAAAHRLPHLVLDGIALAAQAVGADEALPVRARAEDGLLASLEHAVGERQAAGLDPVPIQVTGIPGRYVSSEQSAIVQYLNGGPGKPTFSPPRPHERGVRGQPDAGQQRRDAGSPGADRPLRRQLVPRRPGCRPRPARCWSRWAARSAGRASTRSSWAPRSGR